MKNKIFWKMAPVFLFFALLMAQAYGAEKPILLGLPTSFFQPLCKSGKLAVDMAIEEINAQGGDIREGRGCEAAPQACDR